MSDKEGKATIHLLGPLGSGPQPAVIVREGSDDVETGYADVMQEGQPISGDEIIELSPHPDSPRVWNVKDRTSLPGSKGPPKVNSQEYRENFERIFGSLSAESLPN